MLDRVMLDPRPYLFGQHESLFCLDCGVHELGVYPYVKQRTAGYLYVAGASCVACSGDYGWLRSYKYRYK